MNDTEILAKAIGYIGAVADFLQQDDSKSSYSMIGKGLSNYVGELSAVLERMTVEKVPSCHEPPMMMAVYAAPVYPMNYSTEARDDLL